MLFFFFTFLCVMFIILFPKKFVSDNVPLQYMNGSKILLLLFFIFLFLVLVVHYLYWGFNQMQHSSQWNIPEALYKPILQFTGFCYVGYTQSQVFFSTPIFCYSRSWFSWGLSWKLIQIQNFIILAFDFFLTKAFLHSSWDPKVLRHMRLPPEFMCL